jgi:hypothetical protein
MKTCSICGEAGHNKGTCPFTHEWELRKAVRAHLAQLDNEMKSPSTHERGKRIAHLCNALEYALDAAEHFGKRLPPTSKQPFRLRAEARSAQRDAPRATPTEDRG